MTEQPKKNSPEDVAMNLSRMALYLRVPLPLNGSGWAKDLEEASDLIRSLLASQGKDE